VSIFIIARLVHCCDAAGIIARIRVIDKSDQFAIRRGRRNYNPPKQDVSLQSTDAYLRFVLPAKWANQEQLFRARDGLIAT
jgi:hypothetical protein